MSAVNHSFQAEVSQVLRLVIHSLYSNQEIFLRELLSNASDALDKRRFSALQRPELWTGDEPLKVRLVPNKEQGTLTLWDNGIGMTDEELKQSLGTIAWSGSREFLKKLEGQSAEALPQLIGQFGVGFYSAFLVSDRVEVVSRAAGADKAHRWESTGEGGFSIDDAERESVGTSIILHLKKESLEYADPYRLRQLVERYSDYLSYPIELLKTGKEDEFEPINRGTALWQRSPKEVTEEQYQELYKHLTHDWQPALLHRHFRIEGTQEFSGLVYVPSRPQTDLFEPDAKHGVRLHVRRVMVMESCEELVPRWLRFVRGVVDSEDLPLNVSRELLQDSKVVRTIKKTVQNQVLDALADLAKDKPEEYEKFWGLFGAVLKEGLHFDPETGEKLSKLLRYESAATGKLVSLDQYLEAAPADQQAIYYVTAPSRTIASQSPFLEKVRQKGYDVLLMTDPVDPFAVSGLTEYGGKKVVSVASPDLKLEGDAEKKPEEEQTKEQTALLDRFGTVLKDQVSSVKASSRLLDSPACLIVPDGGLPPQIERLIRAQGRDLPKSQRILELNLEHPLLKNLQKLEDSSPGSERVQEWMHLIYDQALLAEGSPIEDPAAFAKRLTKLFTSASEKEAAS
ncbi:MAG: Chaperone protein HtpG [Polyangiaceae bacterium]|jgi:molecular chaperone HtpG|nr:Chaperone protein HtpG [Polyangiaceae bacterium]